MTLIEKTTPSSSVVSGTTDHFEFMNDCEFILLINHPLYYRYSTFPLLLQYLIKLIELPLLFRTQVVGFLFGKSSQNMQLSVFHSTVCLSFCYNNSSSHQLRAAHYHLGKVLAFKQIAELLWLNNLPPPLLFGSHDLIFVNRRHSLRHFFSNLAIQQSSPTKISSWRRLLLKQFD